MRALRSRSAALVVVPVALAALAGPMVASADEASKSPQQILADAGHALAQLKAFRASGTDTDKGGTTHLSIIGTASGSARFSLSEGATSVQMIILPKAVYLNANAAYWKANASAKLAAKLAGHWYAVPGSLGTSLRSSADSVTPKHLASCIGTELGTLSNAGTQTLDGKKVIVLRSTADQPGTEPGKLYIAATGSPLLVRALQTGARTKGGKIDKRCEDSPDTSTRSDLRLQSLAKAPKITAPKGAVALPSGEGTVSA